MSGTDEQLREQVRQRYAAAATAVSTGHGHGCGTSSPAAVQACCAPAGAAAAADSESGGCCSPASCAPQSVDVDDTFYSTDEQSELPADALAASLGCGNPLAVADLHPGERVLDLGSGGGIDVLLSARRVGPTGYAYGVDMTEQMLTLANANKAKAGADNVEFLQGSIEDIPLPDEAVDVVISNCVINLSVDKPAVLAEMLRVLAPGGRIGISDVVAEDHLTAADRTERGSYVGCIAGALSTTEYLHGLTATGFTDTSVTFTHQAAPGMHAAIIRATKPTNPAGGQQAQHTVRTRRGVRSAAPSIPAGKAPVMSSPPTVLFVCVHNAGRSQMAAGWLTHLAGDTVDVRSAGSEPAQQLNPAAVTAMAEVGIDITAAQPKILTVDTVRDSDVVITMGCGDTCPVFPGKRYEDWDLPDPAGKDLDTVRAIRDQIHHRVETLIAELQPHRR